jgi:hypothetical protein
MIKYEKDSTIDRQTLIDHLWERRANEYVLKDDRETFKLDDVVTVGHVRPVFNNELHDVEFKVLHLLERSICCPLCQPNTTHEHGVNVLRKYFKEKLQLADSELEECGVESEDCIYDFLVYDRLVVHYFDSSYFINFTKESDEMIAMMAEFADSKEFDLLPVIYTDITNIEKGGDLILFPDDDDEEDYE